MLDALTRSANDTIFASQGTQARHFDAHDTPTDCLVIKSSRREVAPDFSVVEQAGPRQTISVRESEVPAVFTGDRFTVGENTYRVDARVEDPGDFHCITVAVTDA